MYSEIIGGHSMSAPLVVFGETVRELRRYKGLPQEKLAELSGLNRTYIGGIERGERNIGLLNILHLAQALKVAPSELFRHLGLSSLDDLTER